MNEGLLIRKNLFRKPLRTTLLIISIFIAFFIFGMLTGFLDSFNRTSDSGAANRIVVTNKINFTQPLPISYVARVQSAPGVTATTYATWFGGFFQEPRNFLPTFAVEPVSYLAVYADQIKLTEAEKETFRTDRRAIIVGRDHAEQFGWKVGQQVPISSNIFSQRDGRKSWDFVIAGIFDGVKPTDPTSGVYVNYQYFNESRSFGQDLIGQVIVMTPSADQNEAIGRQIDALFANSPYETATQDERAFNRSFIQQLGDLTFIITMVVGAAFAAILMIVGNTMVSAVRERTREIGVMKTLGFSSPRVLRMVLTESMALALIGALLGLLAAAGALYGLNSVFQGGFGSFSMSPFVFGAGLLLGMLLGLVTGALPALNALNLKIVDALGRR